MKVILFLFIIFLSIAVISATFYQMWYKSGGLKVQIVYILFFISLICIIALSLYIGFKFFIAFYEHLLTPAEIPPETEVYLRC